VQFYRSNINEQDLNVCHFFKREYSYAVYGSQAVSIAREFYRSRDVLKNENGLECITISRRFFSSIVLSLLENNKSIHVWTKRQGGDWVVQCQASPGYTQEIEKEITSEESKLLKDASVLAAIQIQIQIHSDEEVSTARRKKSSARSSGNQSDRKVHIGMAIMSNAANRLTLMEFKDDVKFSRLVHHLFSSC
jgi:hypothetical protein